MEKQNIIHNWAIAISNLAIEDKKTDEYIASIKDLITLFEKNWDVKEFFSNNFIEETVKEKVIDVSLKKQINDLLINALKLMVKRKVFDSVCSILKYSLKLLYESKNIENGIVLSSVKISDSMITTIEQKLSTKLNKKVKLENVIDESIIAGILVEVANKSYDFSIKGKIEDIKNDLKENRN
ncbi:F0F1 ATP synthase subunit delta [Spiroplasma corruscae]|uniref:ATP synthase subunit delta n=1 Tax=Spiroplasma corruscae TaxID=216934 RepID=A0A222EMT4_9MOLU|nr:ATP synthase F1 subunit delta [Spiroplasma corruscae]ASP27822.1 F0F1 ATP synthase subunit delta [Spiroplasma corruscae]